MKRVKVERVVIVGVPATWEAKKSVLLREGDSRLQREVELQMNVGTEGQANWAIVRNPAVGIGAWWEITF
jgi:alpha 1,3-glucosidase